ncbi:hypothetical protein ABW19_dt0207614 [Dactylella cylindrospora]|nr:hypothetical protein ABW19_dt0207614 [Dactylella cylindrospora]
MEEELNLGEELGLQAFAHQDLEGKVAEQAESAMLKKEMELSSAAQEKEAEQIQALQAKLEKLDLLIKSSWGPKKVEYQERRKTFEEKIKLHEANIQDIERRLAQRTIKVSSAMEDILSRDQRKGESKRDYLIRKGIINPLTQSESLQDEDIHEEKSASLVDGKAPLSYQNLKAPGFDASKPATRTVKRAKVAISGSAPTLSENLPEAIARKPTPPVVPKGKGKERAAAQIGSDQKVAGFEGDYEPAGRSLRARHTTLRVSAVDDDESESNVDDDSDEYKEDMKGTSQDEDAAEFDDEDETIVADPKQATGKKTKKSRKATESPSGESEEESLREYDDGYEDVFQRRIKIWCTKRASAREEAGEEDGGDSTPEWFKPSPSAQDYVIDPKFKVPGDIAQSLFDYQKTAVDWLWRLHSKHHTGGILGDEMGLGKTIQTIAFIAGLHYSQLLTKPVLVVAPATVLKQWCNEFHKWWPPMRVSILHSSGSGMLSIAADKKAERRLDNEEEADVLDMLEQKLPRKAERAAKKIVNKVKAKGHVLISTYSGLNTYQNLLLDTDWECVILDEGHKIRNPDAKISLTAKKLKSSSRFILSGTPIQNNLKELWSLFDFVYPGKLGTLPVFEKHLATPIRIGGYVGAANLAVHVAVKCARVLHELINPYILRRLKADVAVLPPKQDQVLFCNLVSQQKEAYEAYLRSPEMARIYAHNTEMLVGIDTLRKICNHPDLCDRDKLIADPDYTYGNPVKSGKMQIVKGLLKAWEKDKHKSLIFSQTNQMLDILEKFMKKLGYSYLRMDGSTNIKTRQSLVDRFNSDPNLQVFLSTTKTGGYGVNLTGATRIIIFDPDWNPSNDTQARERSWRLGQKNEVRIYRLLCRGTIEEKIYQRQLYKQFLTKKILEDPDQRRTFRMNDMQDLFTLGGLDTGTETGGLFKGVERTLEEAKKVDDDEDAKQVRSITGVAGLENFVGSADNMLSGSMGGDTKPVAESEGSKKKGGKKDKPTSKEDQKLLDAILAKAGVHSIVEHDQIMSGLTSSSEIIEREANKVASEARRQLTASFENIQKQSVPGAPTWTGRRGKTGNTETRETDTKDAHGFLKIDQLEPTFMKWAKRMEGRFNKTDVIRRFGNLISKDTKPAFLAMLNRHAILTGDDYEMRTKPS